MVLGGCLHVARWGIRYTFIVPGAGAGTGGQGAFACLLGLDTIHEISQPSGKRRATHEGVVLKSVVRFQATSRHGRFRMRVGLYEMAQRV